MTESILKFQMIFELQELAERAFIHKLREQDPDISEDDIKDNLDRWYKIRPGAEFGDGDGTPVDPARRFPH
jgi:hypothetical protein